MRNIKIGCLALALCGSIALSSAFAQIPQAKGDLSDACESPVIRKSVVDFMNMSVGLNRAKLTAVAFEDTKTLSVDPSVPRCSCHGTLRLSNGKRYPGTVTIVADKAPTLDWYDDDPDVGLAAASGAASPMPKDQSDVIRAVLTARSNYEKARNDFAKGSTRPQRAKAICAAMKHLTPTVGSERLYASRLTVTAKVF